MTKQFNYKEMLKSSKKIIKLALKEDIGKGDITTELIVGSSKKAKARLVAKEKGIFCGADFFQKVFNILDENSVKITFLKKEGDSFEKDDVLAILEGKFKTILTGERTALNLIQRMCGIATITSEFVEKLQSTNTKLLDTRKTLPGLRLLDKYAVKIGGGKNHRIGLFDMILLKENHIKIAGSITNAVETIRKHNKKLKIEVETSSLNEVKEAINCNVDIIMLDNMTIVMMKEAVQLINGKAKVEASGNVNLENIRNIAETGVDFISVGKITHSVSASVISLLID
jgi:nicotinate-nucleotide pyrophosphorylase (carboxylating)